MLLKKHGGKLACSCCSNTVDSLRGKRVVLFSYGSGLAASMFSLRFTDDRSPDSPLQHLVSSLSDLQSRLDSRHKVAPEDFDKCMKLREQTHHLGELVWQHMKIVNRQWEIFV